MAEVDEPQWRGGMGMNRVFRLVWNRSLGAWQVASEKASSRGRGAMAKRAVGLLLTGLSMGGHVGATDLPSGGQLVSGSAQLQESQSVLSIQQTSQRAVINWQEFSVGEGKSVEFHQPDASASTLNRVLGSNVSLIQGQISANGQVFLVNPNGILFTPSAQVDVGALVASTLDIASEDFIAGRYAFEGDSIASVSNHGALTAVNGGTVALIAAKVINQGQIEAPQGQAFLAAGRKVLLDLGGPAAIEVEEGALDALVEQGGAIRAAGGQVMLTARAAKDLVSSVINHDGVTDVGSLDALAGSAVLEADDIRLGGSTQVNAQGATGGGQVLVGGDWQGSGDLRQAKSVQVDAGAVINADATQSDAGGKVVLWSTGQTDFDGVIQSAGGQVETSGHDLVIGESASVVAGTWLLDPVDITIDATLASAIASALGSGDVEVSTAGSNTPDTSSGESGTTGDITVDSPIAFDANKLTLVAANDININQTIDAGAAGKVRLDYNQADGSGDYYFANGATIDLSNGPNFETKEGSAGALESYTVVNSWADLPTGYTNNYLNFAFGSDVSDHTITVSTNGSNPYAYLSGNGMRGFLVGLGHSVDLNLVAAAGYSGDYFAPIGAMYPGSMVRDLYLTTNVAGNGGSNNGYTAGLVSYMRAGVVKNVHVTGTVKGEKYQTGGLIGLIMARDGEVVVRDSSFNGTVEGVTDPDRGQNAGLIGSITSYSGNSVSIINNAVQGSVRGSTRVGGFTTAVTEDSGTISIQDNVIEAGLNGTNDSYIAGFTYWFSVADKTSILNNTWDVGKSGGYRNACITCNGFTQDLGEAGVFEGINISTPIYLRLIEGSSPYGESPTLNYGLYSASAGGTLVGDANPSGSVQWNGVKPTSTSNVGAYTLTYGSGITLGNAGYSLAAGEAATWTITRKTVGLSASKTYDGTADLSGAVTITTGVGSETLTYTGATASNAHVATAGKYISAITLGNGSGSASNYQLPTLDASNAAVTITAATLTPSLSNSAYSQAYDGDTTADLTPTYTFSGLVSGDTAAALSHTAAVFNDKDVADANAITVSGLSIDSITGTNGSAASDYVLDATSKSVAATITPATVGLSASKTYDGTDDLTGAVTITTGVGSETLTYTGATASNAHVATAGKYISAITLADATDASGGLASNYQLPTLDASNAAVTITKANATVTANSDTQTYNGQSQSVSGFTATGLVNGETESVLTGVSTSGGTGTNVGSYTLTAAGTDGNYNLTFVDGALTITQRDISLVATSASKTYGEADPTLAVTVSNTAADEGLAMGDSLADVTGSLSRQSGEDVGSYDVVLGAGSKVGNYNVSFNANNNAIMIVPLPPPLPAPDEPGTGGTAEAIAPVVMPVVTAGPSVDSSQAGGLMLIAVSADSQTASQSSDVQSVAQGQPAELVKQAKAMGFMGMLVVDGGVALPVQGSQEAGE